MVGNNYATLSSNWIFIAAFTLLFLPGCVTGIKPDLESGEERVIIGRLDQAEQYYDMHPAFEKAFAFLRRGDLANLAPGKHEIDGDRVFCLINRDVGRKREDANLEAHRKYIDIQYVIEGEDEIGWKPVSACKVVDQAYDESKDIMFFKDAPERWLKIPAGSFAVFFPRDAHAPLIGNRVIHKAVVKIAHE